MLGHGGTHSKINYKTLNETHNGRRQQFLKNPLSMRSHTKSVCRDLVSVYLGDNYIPVYLKKVTDLSIFFV